MKKLGDLMKQLGFNPEAAPGAQEAFLKNLIREAYGVDLPVKKEEQLSFDLRDLIPVDELPPLKKKVGG